MMHEVHTVESGAQNREVRADDLAVYFTRISVSHLGWRGIRIFVVVVVVRCCSTLQVWRGIIVLVL